jgi:hypothetical protein
MMCNNNTIRFRGIGNVVVNVDFIRSASRNIEFSWM